MMLSDVKDDIALSIIVPVHNRAATVRLALESIGPHPGTDWEVIVIDDGSTDAPEVHIEAGLAALNLPAQRRTVIRQDKAGVAAARNKAIETARGTYVICLDSDDLWAPHTLGAILDNLPKLSKPGMFFLQSMDFSGTPGVLADRAGDIKLTSFDNFYDAVFSGISTRFAGCNFGIEHALFHRHGGFDPTFSCSEDTDLFLRLGSRCPVTIFHGAPMIAHRIGSENSLSGNAKKASEGLSMMLEKDQDGAYCVTDTYAALKKQFFSGAMTSAIRVAFSQGHVGLAYRQLIQFMPKLLVSDYRPWVWKLALIPLLSLLKPDSFAFKWYPDRSR